MPGDAFAKDHSSSIARVVALLRVPVAAGLVLLVCYVGLSFLNDERAYFVSDAGGRVSTIRAMERNGGMDVDLGYWAEQWDPTGMVHPVGNVGQIGGRWVTVGTLPTLYLGYPLFELGGYRMMLLIPMLASVACAFAAWVIARRLRPTSSGWPAFWLVGLASPITLYALEFWDHSLGVALLAWGVILLWDALRDSVSWWRVAVAGLLFGGAATVRTEAFVYVAGASATYAIWYLLRTRAWMRTLAVGALLVGAVLVPLAGNVMVEHVALGQDLRTGRTSSYADGSASSSGSRLDGRAELAAQSGTFLDGNTDAFTYVVSIALAGVLLYAAARARGPDPRLAMIALAGAALLYLQRFLNGWGFVPGLTASTPLFAVGIIGMRRDRAHWPLYLVALASLPLVWLLQPLGGILPVWGGRYLLLTGVILVAAAAADLADYPGWFRITMIGFAVVVTAYGIAWMSVRTHDVASAMGTISHLDEPVVIARPDQLFNEAGWFARDQRWLSAQGSAAERKAAEVAEASGAKELAFVAITPDTAPPDLGPYCKVGARSVPFLVDDRMEITTYRLGPKEGCDNTGN